MDERLQANTVPINFATATVSCPAVKLSPFTLLVIARLNTELQAGIVLDPGSFVYKISDQIQN